MNRVFKIVGAMILCVAVLYYGASWALLRCWHEEHSSGDRGELEDSRSDHSHATDATEIECSGRDYPLGRFGQISTAPRVGDSGGVRLTILSEQGAWLQASSSWFIRFLRLLTRFHGLSSHLFLTVLRI